jgi:hypothetical protein
MAEHRVIQDEHYNSSDHCDEHAVEIETSDAGCSHGGNLQTAAC